MNAVDRIVGGLEKRTTVMTETERKRIAIHEAGHATISWKLEHANPLVKVTIVPRGKALGAAWYLPEERPITTREEMLDEMCSTLGGRAAEELYSGQISIVIRTGFDIHSYFIDQSGFCQMFYNLRTRAIGVQFNSIAQLFNFSQKFLQTI